jgi:hypothetical protein
MFGIRLCLAVRHHSGSPPAPPQLLAFPGIVREEERVVGERMYRAGAGAMGQECGGAAKVLNWRRGHPTITIELATEASAARAEESWKLTSY